MDIITGTKAEEDFSRVLLNIDDVVIMMTQSW